MGSFGFELCCVCLQYQRCLCLLGAMSYSYEYQVAAAYIPLNPEPEGLKRQDNLTRG